MKKAGILLVLVLLAVFSINFVSAIDIELQKSNYNSLETLEAEITGGFIDSLIQENIGIYKEGAVHSTGDAVNFIKYQDKYYAYAIVPESPGTYYLRIENTNHYEGTKESDKTVEKSFTISESNSSYLSYNPGVIYTSKDFSIDITAYNKNQDITVEFPEAGFKQTFNLGYNQVKTVYISIANITNTTKSSIKIGSYSLPAIIVTADRTQTNTSSDEYIDLEDVLNLSISEITATMLKDASDIYEIYTGLNGELIENLKVSSSDNENMIVNFPNESNQNVILVKIIGKGSFEGFINISTKHSSIIIPVNIQVTKDLGAVNYSTLSIPPVNQNPELTCAEMNGNYCLEGQSCSALQQTDSIGNLCCIGECKSSTSSSKWFWIILIILILGAGGWFVYKKSKEGVSLKDMANSIISKRSNDYTKRIEPEPKEIRKGLTKS